MIMPVSSTQWTAERVRALPNDGKRYEVIDGELFVTPAPSWEHQRGALAMFQREHVPEYWIVDVAARLIERWGPDDNRPEIIVGELMWQPDRAASPLAIDLDSYFKEVCLE